MQLIVRRPRRYHVSQDTVEEVETAILSDARVAPATMPGIIASVVSGATRLVARAGADAGRISGARHRVAQRRDYFAVMMDLDFSRIAPWFILSARKSVYMFDAWPSRHAEIRRLVDSWGIQYAFVSSSQAAERLGAISDRCTFIWVPEGVDPTRYQQRSFLERDIDVIQLGRRYDAHHMLIAPALAEAGRSYVYEVQKGVVVYQRREDFVTGLSRARISICVPSSITHPERSGDIETMTTRYLQSMTSRCLVLGHAPAEMIELFGYNPVVEIDMARPAEQVLEILAVYDDYMPLIERNYRAVLASHTWKRRWERMAAVLFPPEGGKVQPG